MQAALAVAGGADACGTRRCDSGLDNDCSGTPDNQEPECECPEPGAVRECNTGKLGVCAASMQKCELSSDRTHSSWSSCVGPKALPRDCSTGNDNNCNGKPDQAEPECTVCTVGSTRGCGASVEDGIGLCHAGTQTCALSPSHESVGYVECSGVVGPTLEACGPFQADGVTPTPDANCNGIGGDGDYKQDGSTCTKTATIAGAPRTIFKAAGLPGTVAVHNCESPCSTSYVALKCGEPSKTDTVLGYAATKESAGYKRLQVAQFGSSCTFYGGSSSSVVIPAFTIYVLP